MIKASITDFKQNAERYFDEVTETSDHLIISSAKGKGFVVMSLDQFYSMNITAHELSSKVNETRLDAAIGKLKAGQSFSKELIES
jgi:antitoxin YefM